ncbi:MAG: hypothetical protein GX096_14705 [Clostridiales bacterium]|nr:hypothetical protein [Clostridiales bacterium]
MSQSYPMYDGYRSNTETFDGRMSVSSSVRVPGSEVDYITGLLKPDIQRRSRMQANRKEMEELEKEERKIIKNSDKGISWGKSILFLSVILFTCCMILVFQYGQVVQMQTKINNSIDQIKVSSFANEELKTLIAEASDSATICYAAARDLNMVPAESVEAIHLVAEDPRPRKKVAVAQNDQQTQISAENQATQATAVPVIANNSGY